MNQEADSFIGKMLGQFEILEVIGRGGMATVYRARQASINRIVAVKVLLPNPSFDTMFYARFQREVEILTHLEHPHIVSIHDHGEADSVSYLAMHFLSGGSLAQMLAQGLLSPEDLEKPFVQITQALTYAHQAGFIHRDLKPSNILFDENGNAHVSDFGIAYLFHLTMSDLLGTPAYMSPEQVSGTSFDIRTDIYSLGIVLFECLTGHPPFAAETSAEVLMKHFVEPTPSVRSLWPDVSPAVDAVVAKATAKNPDERYESADAMGKAFQDALHHP